jgi:hypothetical protein
VSRPVARFSRSSQYAWLALCATAGALFSAWVGLSSPLCLVPGALFALSAGALFCVWAQPSIDIYETHVAIGRRTTAWTEIASIEHMGWVVPLVVRIATVRGERWLVVFPGTKDSGIDLLNWLRRMPRGAQIDGVSYREFWGEASRLASKTDTTAEEKESVLPTPRLLLPEDERDVERMYQRLKSVGHLESRDSKEQ